MNKRLANKYLRQTLIATNSSGVDEFQEATSVTTFTELVSLFTREGYIEKTFQGDEELTYPDMLAFPDTAIVNGTVIQQITDVDGRVIHTGPTKVTLVRKFFHYKLGGKLAEIFFTRTAPV